MKKTELLNRVATFLGGRAAEEIKAIINAQYQVALQILNSRKSVLEKGAELLLEREKVEGSELKALMEKMAVEASSPALQTADS